MTDLIIPPRETAMEVFSQANGLQPYLAKIREEIDAFVPDVSTKKGREQIASIAHKVARSKTALDNLGKELVAELKELPKKIDAERKAMRDTLDSWKDEVRKPLTEWEVAEQARIDAHRATIAKMYQLAQATSETASSEIVAALEHVKSIAIGDQCEEFLDEYARTKDGAIAALEKVLPAARKREEDAAELERLRAEQAMREQAEREAAIAREAEQKVLREAEELVKVEREAAERRERELLARAERAEQEKEDAIRDAVATVGNLKDFEIRAGAEAMDHIAGSAAADKSKRERDVAHRSAIMKAAKEDLIATGITEEQAVIIVKAIVAGKVRNTIINF